MFLYFILLTAIITQLRTIQCENKQANIMVDSATGRFIDSYGRECIFHGVNAVYKTAPFIPVGDTTWVVNETAVRKLKAYGVNILRLGLMYAGAMPEKGKLNSSYFDAMETLIQMIQDNGVYTLLDSHQDLFAQKYFGDGFPAWSVIQGNARDFPYPIQSEKLLWSVYYMSESVNAGFGYFYNNTQGLQDYYAQFWAEAARRFAKFPYVIGYELLNEPWPGDVYEHISIIAPVNAYKQNLEPLYDKLSKAIRTEDPDHLIFFESVTWDYRDSGIDHVPGGPEFGNKTVLSYHFYVPPQIATNSTLKNKFDSRQKHGCGSMLTEFEIWEGETDAFKQMLELADVWGESWIGWTSNPLDILSYSTSFLSTFAHPYAQIVAGHIIIMKFEPDSRDFYLVYDTDPKISSNQTVIFVNKDLHYPNGYVTESSHSSKIVCVHDDQNFHVLVSHSDELSRNKTQVRIWISPTGIML